MLFVLSLLAISGAASRAATATPTLVWSDEFNQPVGSGPDATKWGYDIGGGGWGNSELETYTNSRSNSVIVADPDASDGRALAIIAQYSNGQYTSARLNGENIYSFKYGRLEARARVPSGAGLWPAFWALGSDITTVNWPACGEIDVMEWIGSTPGTVYGSLHATGFTGSGLTANYVLSGGATYSDAYHVFAVDWYPNEIVFSVDGVAYEDQKEANLPAGYQWPFTQPFFILLNLAVGGTWPGSPTSSTVFPQSYLVDYVRVYSLPTSTPPPGMAWPPSPPANVSAHSPTPSQIQVTWRPPFSTFGSAITGYTLVRATDPALTQNVTTWNMGLSTSYTDNSVQQGVSYYYSVTATTTAGTSDPSGAVLSTPLAPPNTTTDLGRLTNISCRAQVGTGGNIIIAGFVVGGAGTSGTQSVLVRGSGPALGLDPFDVPGVLKDPALTLTDVNTTPNTVVKTNTGWLGSPAIAAAAAAVGAFPWSTSSVDSAALASLREDNYTAEIAGASDDTGVALVEVYDATPPNTYLPTMPRLTNLSARVQVGTGANVVFAGFVIGGSTPRTVLIRASGPALSQAPFKLSGTLPDPELTLTDVSLQPNVVVATNTVWSGDPQIMAVAGSVGAFPWDTSSLDSAILATLPPGNYTAGVAGANGDTGLALVEVYEVQ